MLSITPDLTCVINKIFSRNLINPLKFYAFV